MGLARTDLICAEGTEKWNAALCITIELLHTTWQITARNILLLCPSIGKNEHTDRVLADLDLSRHEQ